MTDTANAVASDTATEHLPETAPDKRDELRAKIEASERRIAERSFADDAREAAEAARDYAKANPLTVLAGAIGLGIAIGLMTSPGRRAAKHAATGTADAVGGAARTVGGAAKKRVAPMGSMIADTVVAYAIKLIDEAMAGARAGQDRLEDFTDSAEEGARKVRREAEYRAGSAADKTRAVTRRTRRKATRAVREVADRFNH